MVLQRWQSVLLFLAFLLTGAACVLPFAFGASDEAYPMMEWPVLLTINATATVLTLIDIFCYRNLRFQIRLAAIVLLLQAIVFGYGLAVLHLISEAELSSAFTGLPTVGAALMLTWFARRFMIKDRKLLAAADRLR